MSGSASRASHSSGEHTEDQMFKMPTAVAALFVAGLFGLACSSSGLKSRAGDA
jgi:hypothetical protein